jgi:hypothetical protein
MGPGEYIQDRNKCRGEAYMIESAPTYDKIAVATYKTASLGSPNMAIAGTAVPYTTATKWYVLPGAVAVYHTILGD